MEPIEQKTAEVAFRRPIEVEIGGERYKAPQPTLGTLIMASEIIGRNKVSPPPADGDGLVPGTIRAFRESAFIADVVAVLVLGAKRLLPTVRSACADLLFRLRRGTRLSERKWLGRQVLACCTPGDVSAILRKFILKMEIEDFFAVITFLGEINVTGATKVIERQTTAPGRE